MIDLTLPDEDVKMLIDALSCFEKATGMREDISEVERTSIMGAISSVRKKIEQTKQSIITQRERLIDSNGVKWHRYPSDIRPVDGATCMVQVDEFVKIRILLAKYIIDNEYPLRDGFYDRYGSRIDRVFAWYMPQPIER